MKKRLLLGYLALTLVPIAASAKHSDPDGFYLKNDPHWSVSGNEIAAQELARFVTDQFPGGE